MTRKQLIKALESEAEKVNLQGAKTFLNAMNGSEYPMKKLDSLSHLQMALDNAIQALKECIKE